MDNYWLYTLSAIPQTLAAMIALSATFFVFKLNSISEDIRKNRNDLRRLSFLLAPSGQGEIHIIEKKTDEEFAKFYKSGLKVINRASDTLGLDVDAFGKVKEEMSRIIHDEWLGLSKARPGRIADYLFAKEELLTRSLLIKKIIKSQLKWSLISTISVVVASLSALPQYYFFCSNQQTIVEVILVASLISVVYMAYSVWKIATV